MWKQLAPTGFFGGYEHSIDVKGRVILPAKFRPAFDHGGYLSEHLGGCLALWTPEEFTHQLRITQEQASEGGGQLRRARVWAQAAEEIEIDRQGRMMIPPRLRSFAQLTDAVCVNGAIDRVELWNPTLWEPIRREAEELLRADG